MKLESRASCQSAALTTAPSSGPTKAKNSKLNTCKRHHFPFSMYIHGGRDLKEGAISSMWRVNLTAVQQLHQGDNKQVGWDCVATTGKDIGKISHHTCCMVSAKEVVFFGGLKGDSSSNSVFLLNLVGNIWSSISPKVKSIQQN